MKLLFHTMLVLAYAALVMRPSMPLVEYQLRKGFIAAEYCVNQDKPEMKCDGKCYLNKRLADAADDRPSPSEVVFAPSLPVHLIAEASISFPEKTKSPEFPFENWLSTPSYFDSTPSPPPERLV